MDCYIGMKDIQDKSIDLILTDPPYNLTRNKWDIQIDLEKLWQEYHRVIKDNGAILIFGIEPFSSKVRISNIKNYKYDWYWNKSHSTGFLNAYKQPMRKIETISVFYKKPCNYYPLIKDKPKNNIRGTRGKLSTCYNSYDCSINKLDKSKSLPNNILEFPIHNPAKRIFSTQKPVPLLEYLINTYTLENELVLDSFMGSGSTIEACINNNRHYMGFEIDKDIFNIAQNRLNIKTDDVVG